MPRLPARVGPLGARTPQYEWNLFVPTTLAFTTEPAVASIVAHPVNVVQPEAPVGATVDDR